MSSICPVFKFSELPDHIQKCFNRCAVDILGEDAGDFKAVVWPLKENVIYLSYFDTIAYGRVTSYLIQNSSENKENFVVIKQYD